MQRSRLFVLSLISILALLNLAALPARSILGDDPLPPPQSTPAPPATPVPNDPTSVPESTPSSPGEPGEPGEDDSPNILEQVGRIFYYITFPASTLSDALSSAINSAAQDEVRNLELEIARWADWMGEVMQAPSSGHYANIASSSLTAAAALAPALFILRLVLYHWGRLVGQEDSALSVLGDWAMAGIAAVTAGPALDLLTRLSWWLTGLVTGETTALARQFVFTMLPNGDLSDMIGVVASTTIFSGAIQMGLALGCILGIVGLLFAFMAAHAVLYVLAVLAAPLAVIGVLPQMRWLRSLWLKAVGVIILLPIVAGGIFKATVAGGFYMLPSGGGILSGVIRVIWLVGIAGFMLSLASILSRVTLTAAAEGAEKLVGAVKAIASVAAIALSSGAAAPAVAAGGNITSPSSSMGGAPPAGGSDGGTSPGGATPGMDNYSSALSHYQTAEAATTRATWLDAVGLRSAAQFNRGMARTQELQARQSELSGRIERLQDGDGSSYPADANGEDGPGIEQKIGGVSRDVGLSYPVTSKMVSGYKGEPERFSQGFNDLNSVVQQRTGLDLHTFAPAHPSEVGRMVEAYQADPARIEQAENPLQEAAYVAGARGILGDLNQPTPPTWSRSVVIPPTHEQSPPPRSFSPED